MRIRNVARARGTNPNVRWVIHFGAGGYLVQTGLNYERSPLGGLRGCEGWFTVTQVFNSLD